MKVAATIFSHLSDINIESSMNTPGGNLMVCIRTNFVKYLILKYPDTSVDHDAEEDFEDFTEKFPRFKD